LNHVTGIIGEVLMKIIITGGTGLIGRSLAASLAGVGVEVILLSRNPTRGLSGLPAGVSIHGWDGHTARGWEALVNDAEVIVNLAGENIGAGRWTEARKKSILSSRVNAGNAVTEAVRLAEHRPRLVVQSSAVGYYGPHSEEIITEQTGAGKDFLSTVCMDWEASTYEVEKLGVRWVAARTGVVLSTAEGALPRMMLPFKLFAGGPVGSGRQWFPWIHLEDEVRALRFLIENPSASGAYNLCAPNPVTNADFGKALGRAMHRPSVLPAPAFAMKLILGEMSTLLLDGQRQVPQRLEQAGFKFKYSQVDQALQALLQ
jgi:uncharacterized protein